MGHGASAGQSNGGGQEDWNRRLGRKGGGGGAVRLPVARPDRSTAVPGPSTPHTGAEAPPRRERGEAKGRRPAQ